MFKDIGWIGVIVSVIVLEVVGYLYYGVAFKTAWTLAMGAPQVVRSMAMTQTLEIFNTLILVVGLAWLRARLGVASLAGSIGLALAAWFLFGFTTMAIDFLFVGQSGALVALNMGYQLLAYGLTGAILALVPARP